MTKPGIIAIHLLNDFSGSPLVFREALEALQGAGFKVTLFTATPSGKGFLSDMPAVTLRPVAYRWSRNKWLTLGFFLLNQLSLFLRVAWVAGRQDIVYINSMLPFGGALAGWLKGCTVVYHIHEVSIRPARLMQWLVFVINRTASHCIFVSHYVRWHTAVTTGGTVIYNALPTSFVDKCVAEGNKCPAGKEESSFTVLMLCSLKYYKGVNEFIQCASFLPEVRFELVLNSSRRAMDIFFAGRPLPSNLRLFDAQSDTHPFFRRASVVVNLSLPDQWIETFGMTILEAMYYRKPVIVPPVGGVSELVEEGVNGFCVDSRNVEDVVGKIRLLSRDAVLYERMGSKAFDKATCFRQEVFSHLLIKTIDQLLEKQ